MGGCISDYGKPCGHSQMGITIRPATRLDSNSMARIHVKSIAEGFLSSIGEGLLALVYGEAVESGICFVAEDGDRVVGFVSATEDVSAFYRRFMLKRALRAFVAILPRIWRLSFIRKAIDVVMHPSSLDAKLPKAELLSIAVDDEHRGRGVGRMLVARLLDEFQHRKIGAVCVVVGEGLREAIKLYEHAGARRSGTVSVHKGETSFVYTWELDCEH